MSRAQRELMLYRRLLAVAVHRLGGEMKVTAEDIHAHWELGMDHHTTPSVVTAFRLQTPKK